MVKKSNNSTNKDTRQPDSSVDNQLEELVRDMTEKLKRGNGLGAMRLFAEGQAQHLLATTASLPKQLVEVMGKKMASKLIVIFVHSPCPFCKKGCQECENCEGRGHVDYEMVCFDCLSLGLVKCDFCDGSGWSSIDSIPVGLRPIVLSQRTKVAMARIKKILSKPNPQPLQDKPVITLKKCAQLLMDLNRYIGVLENTVIAKDELTKSGLWSKSKASKVENSCIQTAIDAEERAREIVKYMAATARAQAGKRDRDSAAQKLSTARADFYESLLDASDIFSGTNLEHPFLDETMNKLDSRHSGTKRDDQIIL